MSDKEAQGSADDLSLPRATVAKILTEILPPSSNNPRHPCHQSGLATSKDFRDTLTTLSVEFISLLSFQSNEISENEAKKTIAAEHVTSALRELGFKEYIKPVVHAAEEYRKLQAQRERKASKMEMSGLSEEELLRQQMELFRSAGEKYQGLGDGPSGA